MTRPRQLVLVVGTATDIGKTWVGGATLEALGELGATTAARKPAQSFAPDDPHPTDSEVLGAATGEAPTIVCPPHRNYAVPMAPPMAAEVLGLPAPTLDELVDELLWPDDPVDVGWLETVGGPRSPIGVDGDSVTLTDRIHPDVVVLVADAGLGTVNAVLVSIAPFAGHRVVVVLNRFDETSDLHRRNRMWLEAREGLEIVTDPEALARRLLSSTGQAG